MRSPQLIRSGVANDTGRLRPTLQHTLEAALSLSDPMIDELLERLALLRQGALSVGLDPTQKAAVAQLLVRPEALKRDWQAQLRQVLYHGQGDAALTQAGVRFEDLRQLDDRQINASIEFATAEQGLLEPAADLLPRLNALVSNLMGWLSVQADLNPLRPRSYAVALRKLLLLHLPDDRQRHAVHVTVANIMGESLRQVYRELIQWLQAHGVEPLQGADVRMPDQSPSQAVGRTLLTLSRLRQLLAGELNAPSGGALPFMLTVPASMTALEDMDLIEPLLQRLRQRPAAVQGAGPAEASDAPELPVVSGQHLGRLLGQEVVRLMLEHLTHDERLLPPIRRQLGLLEPALIRLSQAEPRFFSDRQHPARQLLEAITQRSLGYQTLADEGFAELQASIDVAVRSIERVQVSEEVFARLLRRLRRRWERDDALKLQRRADAARALLHAEQRQTLAERLAEDLRLRLQDKDVPEFVQRFLVGPWSLAVAEERLAPGPGGDGTQSLDEVTDELIWSAQLALIRRDAERLGRLVPHLLERLREGLARIDFPSALTDLFLDALVALHRKAFDLPTLTEMPPPGDTPAPVGTQGDVLETPRAAAEVAGAAAEQAMPLADTFWMGGQAAEDAGFVSAVSGPMPLEPLAPLDLHTGAWVDLRIKGDWVRAQLTWTSPRGGLYMFISSQGLAHSMTQRTLDRLLGADALRVVSSGGVVDSALDAVARQALRNTRESDGPD